MDSNNLVIILTLLTFIGALIGAFISACRSGQLPMSLPFLPFVSEEQRERWKYLSEEQRERLKYMAVLANLGAVPLSGYLYWAFYKGLLLMRAFERSYGLASDSLESMAPVILTLILLWLATIGALTSLMLRTFKLIDESRPSAKKDDEGAS